MGLQILYHNSRTGVCTRYEEGGSTLCTNVHQDNQGVDVSHPDGVCTKMKRSKTQFHINTLPGELFTKFEPLLRDQHLGPSQERSIGGIAVSYCDVHKQGCKLHIGIRREFEWAQCQLVKWIAQGLSSTKEEHACAAGAVAGDWRSR